MVWGSPYRVLDSATDKSLWQLTPLYQPPDITEETAGTQSSHRRSKEEAAIDVGVAETEFGRTVQTPMTEGVDDEHEDRYLYDELCYGWQWREDHIKS